MRRLIVTGSRDWTDREAVQDALWDYLFDYGPFILVHGACPTGVDSIAADWASMVGIKGESLSADWQRHGRAAGPMRNAAMVESGANDCLAFPLGDSRGTRGCMALAKAAGIAVHDLGDRHG